MAIRGSRRRPRRELQAPPDPAQLRPAAVTSFVRRRAARSPATVASVITAGLAAAAIPVLGVPAAALAAAGALTALAAYARRAFGPAAARAASERIAELARLDRAARLDALAALADDFTYLGLHAGATQSRELAQAWTTLADALDARADGLDQQLSRMADEGLAEGRRLLEAARDARAALEAVDARQLERELEQWQRQRERLDVEADAAAAANLELRIEAHRDRLGLLAEQQAAIERLLAEVERLESALEQAYLGLVSRGTDAALARPENAAAGLASAVEVARRVDARVAAMLDG